MSKDVLTPTVAQSGRGDDANGRRETLTIVDNRTGRSYEVPIADGTIRATDLRKIKVTPDEFGMMSYDPAFQNTAACRSAITFIDGDKGILQYRGYSIEELAERSNYLEVAYLLIHGDLPTKQQYEEWHHHIMHHTFVHEGIKEFMHGFRHDAHPMGMLLGTVGALSTFYPDAKQIHDPRSREIQTHRLIAKITTIAAFAYRFLQGQPLMYPSNRESYVANFVEMMFSFPNQKYELKPALVRALELLFILHADHEQNASAAAVRNVGSTEVDPYSAVAAGIAALYGPLHGGANEAVLRMLREIGSVKNVPDYVEKVKKGERKLMGFGHRVYKNYDPRARVIKRAAEDVFEVTGVNPLLEIALQLEHIALEEDYFLERKLYPNVDFYSGLIYEAMGMPAEFFTVLFAIPRTSGWLAQWLEGTADPEQKIARPRQVYTGPLNRGYVSMAQRTGSNGQRAW